MAASQPRGSLSVRVKRGKGKPKKEERGRGKNKRRAEGKRRTFYCCDTSLGLVRKSPIQIIHVYSFNENVVNLGLQK